MNKPNLPTKPAQQPHLPLQPGKDLNMSTKIGETIKQTQQTTQATVQIPSQESPAELPEVALQSDYFLDISNQQKYGCLYLYLQTAFPQLGIRLIWPYAKKKPATIQELQNDLESKAVHSLSQEFINTVLFERASLWEIDPVEVFGAAGAHKFRKKISQIEEQYAATYHQVIGYAFRDDNLNLLTALRVYIPQQNLTELLALRANGRLGHLMEVIVDQYCWHKNIPHNKIDTCKTIVTTLEANLATVFNPPYNIYKVLEQCLFKDRLATRAEIKQYLHALQNNTEPLLKESLVECLEENYTVTEYTLSVIKKYLPVQIRNRINTIQSKQYSVFHTLQNNLHPQNQQTATAAEINEHLQAISATTESQEAKTLLKNILTSQNYRADTSEMVILQNAAKEYEQATALHSPLSTTTYWRVQNTMYDTQAWQTAVQEITKNYKDLLTFFPELKETNQSTNEPPKQLNYVTITIPQELDTTHGTVIPLGKSLHENIGNIPYFSSGTLRSLRSEKKYIALFDTETHEIITYIPGVKEITALHAATKETAEKTEQQATIKYITEDGEQKIIQITKHLFLNHKNTVCPKAEAYLQQLAKTTNRVIKEVHQKIQTGTSKDQLTLTESLQSYIELELAYRTDTLGLINRSVFEMFQNDYNNSDYGNKLEYDELPQFIQNQEFEKNIQRQLPASSNYQQEKHNERATHICTLKNGELIAIDVCFDTTNPIIKKLHQEPSETLLPINKKQTEQKTLPIRQQQEITTIQVPELETAAQAYQELAKPFGPSPSLLSTVLPPELQTPSKNLTKYLQQVQAWVFQNSYYDTNNYKNPVTLKNCTPSVRFSAMKKRACVTNRKLAGVCNDFNTIVFQHLRSVGIPCVFLNGKVVKNNTITTTGHCFIGIVVPKKQPNEYYIQAIDFTPPQKIQEPTEISPSEKAKKATQTLEQYSSATKITKGEATLLYELCKAPKEKTLWQALIQAGHSTQEPSTTISTYEFREQVTQRQIKKIIHSKKFPQLAQHHQQFITSCLT